MSLFPWPQNDAEPRARRHVWWKRAESGARGLLIDSPAVPLRFAPDAAPVESAVPIQAAPVTRLRRHEQLLMIRDLNSR